MSPVRPPPLLSRPDAGDDDGFESVQDAPMPAVAGEDVQFDQGDMLDAEGDDVVQPALCLPCPKTPTDHEVAVHNLTHLPYRSWCRHCVAARRPNTHHRSSPASRSMPLLAADYCFLGDTQDENKVTCLSLIHISEPTRPY